VPDQIPAREAWIKSGLSTVDRWGQMRFLPCGFQRLGQIGFAADRQLGYGPVKGMDDCEVFGWAWYPPGGLWAG
jgi:hypothetical protein